MLGWHARGQSHYYIISQHYQETKCDYSFLDLCFSVARLGCNDNSVFFVEGFERTDPWSAAAFFFSLGQVIADVHVLFDWLVAMLSNKSSMLMEEADGLDAWSAKAGSGVIRAGAASTTCVITARRSQCECSTSEANVGNIQFIIRDSAVSSAGWLG